MKKLILSVTIFLLTVSTLFAQSPYYYDIRLSRDLFDMSRLETEHKIENYYEGTPYLEDQFINGVVYTHAKTKYVDIPMRYDVYDDVIEFKTESNQILTLSNPDIVEKVEFDGYNLVYVPYSFANKSKKGFFNVLVDGEAELLCKYKVDFNQATEAKAFRSPEPAKFVSKPEKYYIKLREKYAEPVENRKSLLSILNDKNDNIADFIKTNKLNIRDPKDLTKIVTYYNSL